MDDLLTPWYNQEYPDLCKYTRRKALNVKVPKEIIDASHCLQTLCKAIKEKMGDDYYKTTPKDYCLDHLGEPSNERLFRWPWARNLDKGSEFFKRWLTYYGYTWSDE